MREVLQRKSHKIHWWQEMWRIQALLTHLWGNVVRSAAESSRSLVTDYSFFAHSKVGNFYVTFRVQHDVVKFQISEKNSTNMQYDVEYLIRKTNWPVTIHVGLYIYGSDVLTSSEQNTENRTNDIILTVFCARMRISRQTIFQICLPLS
jgi:hypothetical protein